MGEDTTRGTTPLYLRTLGGLSLHRDGPGGEVLLHSSKPLAVCAYLAATTGHEARRRYLAELLWPGSDESRALASLRQAIYYLSKKSGTTLLDADEGTLSLRTRRIRLDLWEFRDHLEAGRCADAAALYEGPFLEGFSVEEGAELSHWVEAQQDRIRTGLRASLHESVADALEEGRTDEALAMARRFAALDPLDERAQTALVEAHLAAGDRVAALQAYQRYRTLLRRALGERPDEDLEARVARLRETLYSRPLVTPGTPDQETRARPDGPAAPEAPRRWRPAPAAWLAAGIALGAAIAAVAVAVGLLDARDRTGAGGPPDAMPAAAAQGLTPAASGETALLLGLNGEPVLWSLRVPERGEPRLGPTDLESDHLLSPRRDRAVKVRGPRGVDLALLTREGRRQRLTDRPDDEWWGAWSPDGRYLLFAQGGLREDGEYRRRPWIYDRETGEKRPLLPADALGSPGFEAANAAWAPTGLWIAFSARVDGNREVFVMRPDGSGLRNVSDHPAADGDPAWCPHGGRLVFASDRGGGWDLYRTEPERGAPERLTSLTADVRFPAWLESAGGEETAVVMDDGTGADVWTVDGNGELLRRLTRRGDVRRIQQVLRPENRRWVREVTIRRPGATAREGTADVSPGQWLTLEARVEDARDLPASAADLEIRWTTTDPGVVRLGPKGRARVVGEGAARLVASAGGWRADTLRLRSRPLRASPRPTLLAEDWSAGLRTARWLAYGEPPPAVLALEPDGSAAAGTAPAARGPRAAEPHVLVSNGDAHFTSGAVSRRAFPVEAGLTLEYRLRAPLSGRVHEALHTGLVAPPLPDDTVASWDAAPTDEVLRHSVTGHEAGAVLERTSVRRGGHYPATELPGRVAPDGAWHTYALQLGQEGTATLVADGRLLWRSEVPVDLTGVDSVHVLLAGRTVPSRPVHGPVRLYRGVRYAIGQAGARLALEK